SVLDALIEFAVRRLIVTLQSYHHIEFFLAGDVSHLEYLLNAGGVGGDSFLHKNMLALPNRFFEVNGAKSRRRCKNNDVGEGNRFFIGVESDELRFFCYGDL